MVYIMLVILISSLRQNVTFNKQHNLQGIIVHTTMKVNLLRLCLFSSWPETHPRTMAREGVITHARSAPRIRNWIFHSTTNS